MIYFCRVEKLKKLKENGHGRYDEITEEKLVLQTSMCVLWIMYLRPLILCTYYIDTEKSLCA